MTQAVGLTQMLTRLRACKEAKKWAKTQPNLQTAWYNCERPDWMLWLLVKLHGYVGAVVLATCDCAATALPIWERTYPDDSRPRVAIATARRYAAGKTTRDECFAAAEAAYAAARAASSDVASSDAAYAAAAAAAGGAAAAAYTAAGCAGFYGARIGAAERRMARLIRKRIPNPETLP
jgi:hypothetical protein